ncbi:hypothetical protein F4677DRAFT_406132 [Hypoxylon crocopeplum]|nr:hypothetical protein F4677DRAFT_406132 [Hypoxylon crocopeplum]
MIGTVTTLTWYPLFLRGTLPHGTTYIDGSIKAISGPTLPNITPYQDTASVSKALNGLHEQNRPKCSSTPFLAGQARP